MAENSLFENLSFNPFNFESILLNNNQDPDENLTENFNNCSYFTPDELKNSIEMIPLKGFSIIRNHDFSVISLIETWFLDDPRNETLYKLDNYTSIHLPWKPQPFFRLCPRARSR